MTNRTFERSWWACFAVIMLAGYRIKLDHNNWWILLMVAALFVCVLCVWKKEEPVADAMKPTLPVGVSILLTDGAGNVLLAKRKNNSGAGLLSTPGGRLEKTENIYECAHREFAEECTADLGPVQVVAWREHFRFGNHYIMFYAHAADYAGKIINGIPDKSEDWNWYSIEGVLEGRFGECTEPDDILRQIGTIGKMTDTEILDWTEKNCAGNVRGTECPKWCVEGDEGDTLREAVEREMKAEMLDV